MYEFEARGLYNAGLGMWDIETESVWSPFDGAAMEGPPQGTVLTRVPCLQTTWREWLALHPDTEVVIWEPWPTHRDARHGHGTVKWVGSAGVEGLFTNTIEAGSLDTRLAENALMVGIQVNGRARAYPLLEVRKGNNVINDELGGEPLTVFAQPDSHTMAAYQRTFENQTLDFVRENGAFKDRQSGSTWNIEGLAMDGPMKGKRLSPTDWHFMEWHTWSSYHRPSEIYTYPEAGKLEPEPADLARLVEGLRSAGHTVEVEGEYLYALLPLSAERGLTATVDGERLSFFVFPTANDASDFAAYRAHAVQAGSAAVQSDPLDVYTDETLTTYKDDAEISWSTLIGETSFLALVEKELGSAGTPSTMKSYQDIFASLTRAGYRAEIGGGAEDAHIKDVDFMLGYILPAKAVDGVWARINGDRFMIIRFADAASAHEHARERAHRASAGHVVFRSDPEKQYRLPAPILTIELPEDEIAWSALPDDANFQQAIKAAVGS